MRRSWSYIPLQLIVAHVLRSFLSAQHPTYHRLRMRLPFDAVMPAASSNSTCTDASLDIPASWSTCGSPALLCSRCTATHQLCSCYTAAWSQCKRHAAVDSSFSMYVTRNSQCSRARECQSQNGDGGGACYEEKKHARGCAAGDV